MKTHEWPEDMSELRKMAVKFEKHLKESGLGHLCSSPELGAKGLNKRRLMRELDKLLNE